jgi:hypothetical protein
MPTSRGATLWFMITTFLSISSFLPAMVSYWNLHRVLICWSTRMSLTCSIFPSLQCFSACHFPHSFALLYILCLTHSLNAFFTTVA